MNKFLYDFWILISSIPNAGAAGNAAMERFVFDFLFDQQNKTQNITIFVCVCVWVCDLAMRLVINANATYTCHTHISNIIYVLNTSCKHSSIFECSYISYSPFLCRLYILFIVVSNSVFNIFMSCSWQYYYISHLLLKFLPTFSKFSANILTNTSKIYLL